MTWVCVCVWGGGGGGGGGGTWFISACAFCFYEGTEQLLHRILMNLFSELLVCFTYQYMGTLLCLKGNQGVWVGWDGEE